MPFHLSRGGVNVIAEVQRWQFFLRRMGIDQVGPTDGSFGMNTENATKFFQIQSGLSPTGKVADPVLNKAREFGYSILPDDYYQQRASSGYPAAAASLSSPSNASRNQDFTCFKFLQRPRSQRTDNEAIVMKGSCDGSIANWEGAKIINIAAPQLRFAQGFNGRVRCHHLAAPLITKLLEAWEAADLLHLIRSYEGCFVPRYIRNRAPQGEGGHSTRDSKDVPQLSNHSFGSAFDINFVDNQLGHVPALCGRRGSVRELVEAANALGIFWGGHFANTKDGMHFEISKLPAN